MKQNLVLINARANYADEFDVYGFIITTKEQWDKKTKALKKSSWPMERYFGTNEYIDFTDFKDFMRSCTVKPITMEEALNMVKLLGDSFSVKDFNEKLAATDPDMEGELLFEFGEFPWPEIGEEDVSEDEE